MGNWRTVNMTGSSPGQDQAARTLTALRSALTDAMVRWSGRDVLDECSGDLARILDQYSEPAAIPASTAAVEIVPWSDIQPSDLVLLDGRMVTAERTGAYEDVGPLGSICTRMRLVYAKDTGGVGIREVSPADLTARRRPAPPAPVLTTEELHARFACPGWEYRMTTGQRKAWADAGKPPDGDGWEPNTAVCPEAWERFDYHEEAYWRRPVPDSTTTAAGTGEQ